MFASSGDEIEICSSPPCAPLSPKAVAVIVPMKTLVF